MSAPPGFDPTASVLPQPGGSLPQIHVQSGGSGETATKIDSVSNVPVVPPISSRLNTSTIQVSSPTIQVSSSTINSIGPILSCIQTSTFLSTIQLQSTFISCSMMDIKYNSTLITTVSSISTICIKYSTIVNTTLNPSTFISCIQSKVEPISIPNFNYTSSISCFQTSSFFSTIQYTSSFISCSQISTFLPITISKEEQELLDQYGGMEKFKQCGFDIYFIRSFVNQLQSGQCSKGLGDTIILKKDCWAVSQFIRKLIQLDISTTLKNELGGTKSSTLSVLPISTISSSTLSVVLPTDATMEKIAITSVGVQEAQSKKGGTRSSKSYTRSKQRSRKYKKERFSTTRHKT